MVKGLLLFALTFACFVALAAQGTPQPTVVAISGCCKHREGGAWVNIGRDFDQCSDLNADEGDDIFAPEGNVWWDSRC